jgi:flavin reductase (DIM6/NTAB) family NADH-FMN oxidoreductase RutF
MSHGANPLLPAFKAAMRRMAATVCVIAAAGPDGTRRGITASSVVSLSAEPPALLVAINTRSSLHEVVWEGSRLSINLLSRGQEAVARAFASLSVRGGARFDVGRWTDLDGVPALEEAQAVLQCVVERVVGHSTHAVLFVTVHAVQVSAQVAPLLYLDGRYRSLTQ